LFATAVAAGIGGLKNSEADWLRFNVAAVHAVRVGKKQVALFVGNVRAGRFDFGAIEDETEAHRRIKCQG
jgi:hypothetical protein